jgi:hypothetical protein
MRTVIVLVLAAATALVSHSSNANEITITQIGDNLDLTVVQKGGNNVVKEAFWNTEFNGDDQTIILDQQHSDGTSNNVIEIGVVAGDNNNVEIRQGSDNLGGNGVRSDATEYSGHYAHAGVIGDNNNLRIGQRNPDNSPHSAYAVIYYVDNVDVEITQGDSGSKDAEVWVNAADSKVDVLQHGSGQHTAYIDVSGMYGTDVQLEQNSSTAQSYSLTQYCTNANGCSIITTQN